MREFVRQYADSCGPAGGTSIKRAIRLTSVGCKGWNVNVQEEKLNAFLLHSRVNGDTNGEHKE